MTKKINNPPLIHSLKSPRSKLTAVKIRSGIAGRYLRQFRPVEQLLVRRWSLLTNRFKPLIKPFSRQFTKFTAPVASRVKRLSHVINVQWQATKIKKLITLKNAIFAGGGALLLLAVGYTVTFFWPRTVQFNFANNNCITNPVLMPRLISKNKSSTYTATPVTSVTIAGYPVFSRATCLSPIKAPKQHTTEVITFGSTLMKKNIRVSVGAYPSLTNSKILDKPVSVQEPLKLKFSSADNIFKYQLLINDSNVMCIQRGGDVVCDISKLNLAQSTKYDLTLKRLFNGSPAGSIFTRSISTVEDVHFTSSTIAAGQIIFDAPNELSLTLNRPAIAIDGAHLFVLNGDARQEIAATITLLDKTVTTRFSQPLARSKSYVLIIDKIKAADGGFLPTPYSLPFNTSGGPKAVSISIGSFKVPLNTAIVIAFDAPISKTQALADFIKIDAAGTNVTANIGAQNNVITVSPVGDLPRCTPLTVKVLDGLQNFYGISGSSAWQYKSRTICQNVFSIGASAQGRSITAYSFGSGPSKIIFVGATHGDEYSSAFILNRWVDYLENNFSVIPANRTVIIIPKLNPDGYVAGRRTNANNVDLNRNFPANNWKQIVIMPDKTTNNNGGGVVALSEPESSAIANYIVSQGPRLVLTYHAIAGVVMPNDSGDSSALAQLYDQKSNVSFAANSQTGSIFQYDTTGSMEEWLYDRIGVPTLLIELRTMSGNEFSSHQAAMLAMIQLP